MAPKKALAKATSPKEATSPKAAAAAAQSSEAPSATPAALQPSATEVATPKSTGSTVSSPAKQDGSRAAPRSKALSRGASGKAAPRGRHLRVRGDSSIVTRKAASSSLPPSRSFSDNAHDVKRPAPKSSNSMLKGSTEARALPKPVQDGGPTSPALAPEAPLEATASMPLLPGKSAKPMLWALRHPFGESAKADPVDGQASGEASAKKVARKKVNGTRRKASMARLIGGAKASEPAARKVEDLVFTFRFLNFNMCNKPDIHMLDLGTRFYLQRCAGSAADLDDGEHREVSFEELLACGVPPAEEMAATDQMKPSATQPMVRSWSEKALRRMRKYKTVTGFTFMSGGGGKTQPLATPPEATQAFLPSPSGTRRPVDCAFAVLCETKYALAQYDRAQLVVESSSSRPTHQLRALSVLDQLTERGGFKGMHGRVADALNGDLRTLMLCRNTLEEVEDGFVFHPYDDISAGFAKSNPMKCILGQQFSAACGALKFLLLGTHFPMRAIAEMMKEMDEPSDELLGRMKGQVARTLRDILRDIHQRALLDERTVVILQGDLNSRTVLEGEDKFTDLLWLTLQDPSFQNFMSAELPPRLQGDWLEVVPHADPGDLPVTYKFDRERNEDSLPPPAVIRLRDVYDISGRPPAPTEDSIEPAFRPGTATAEAHAAKAEEVDMRMRGTPTTAAENYTMDDVSCYRTILDRMNERRDEWGFSLTEMGDDNTYKFKPSRLPGSTERIIWYAPFALQQRCYWEVEKGYEVCYHQEGSDHKPVLLEASLRIGTKISAAVVESEKKRHSVAMVNLSEVDEGLLARRQSAVTEQARRSLSSSSSHYDSDDSSSGCASFTLEPTGPPDSSVPTRRRAMRVDADTRYH